jgi:protein HOOK3
MVSAAALGPDNQKYVPRIQGNLDREAQGEIMQVLRVVQQDIAASKDDNDLDEAIDAVMEARDIDLVIEEQNAQLRQELEITKKKLSDHVTRLEHLQQSHLELSYEKENNDRELEVLRKATQDGANSAESVKMLEAQVHEQMEIISRSEETIRNHEKMRAHLEAEVQRLTQRSILADELQDQATEWKHKAEELEKKANTAERYKQKLESQQHLAKEVQNLQYERAELQEQLRSLADDKDRDSRTRKAEDELTKMITQSEQHLWDERNQKNQLLRDVTALEEELMRLRAQRSHDESFIQDLQDQLHHGVGVVAQGDAEGAASSLNLEDELNFAGDDAQKSVPLELSRLKAENDLLRRTMGSTGDAAVWRRELDEARSQREQLQKSFNDIFEKHTLAQAQIDALIQKDISEGSKAFAELRAQDIQRATDLEAAQKRVEKLEADNADMDREVKSTKSLLSALEKDSIEGLQELKQTDKMISEPLQAELDRLREKYNYLLTQKDAQQVQLIEALIDKDKLRKAFEEGKDVHETTTKDSDASQAGKKETEKVEKLRARLIERNAVSTSDDDARPDIPILGPNTSILLPTPPETPLFLQSMDTFEELTSSPEVWSSGWHDPSYPPSLTESHSMDADEPSEPDDASWQPHRKVMMGFGFTPRREGKPKKHIPPNSHKRLRFKSLFRS